MGLVGDVLIQVIIESAVVALAVELEVGTGIERRGGTALVRGHLPAPAPEL